MYVPDSRDIEGEGEDVDLREGVGEGDVVEEGEWEGKSDAASKGDGDGREAEVNGKLVKPEHGPRLAQCMYISAL